MDEPTQLELFSKAVDLIGGIGSAARALGIAERNLRRIFTGERRLHTGLLDDMAKALLAHSAACRQLERQLSPLYSANLTQAQAKPPLHDGRGPQRAAAGKRLPAEQVAEMAARLGIANPVALTVGRKAVDPKVEFAGDDEPIRGLEIGEG